METSAFLGGIKLRVLAASPLALAAGLALSPAVAVAQQGSTVTLAENSDVGSLEEVVVTARKRAERLRDVPTAGTALGADVIRELGGVQNAQSLVATSPGVNFANTANPVTSEISIRGSGTSRATNAESGVGLYRNGAFIGGGTVGGRTFTDLDLFDLERLEVLRGVQGGLGGRNASGGSINVLSARPSNNFDGYAFATIASNKRYGIQIASNIPINDNWSARVSGELMEQKEGFYKIYLLGNQYADQQERNFLRGQIRYENGPFTANLLAEHGFSRLPGLIYRITQVPNAVYPSGFQHNRFEPPFNFLPKAKMQLNNYEFTTSYDFGFGTLHTTSMDRYRWGQNIYERDATSLQYVQSLVSRGLVAPASVATVLAGDYTLEGDQGDRARIRYHDVHLTAEKVGRFEWLAGFEYFLLRDRPFSLLGRRPTPGNPSLGTIDIAQLRFESYAFYGSASFDLTDQLELSGDLRRTTDDEVYSTRRLDYRTGLPANAAFAIDGERGGNNISYTASLTYRLSPNTITYAKMGSAYRAGGFNTSRGDTRQPITPPVAFDDEEVTAYELGFKGNLLPNVYVAAAAYLNDFDSLVIQGDNGCFLGSLVCPVQQTVFAFNAGPARLWGVEAEVTARFTVADGPLRLSVGASRQGGKITGGIYDGRRQPQQPDYTATFNLNYRHAIGSDMTGFVNLKGNGRWGGVQEVAQIPTLNDFVLVDGRIGIERGPVELALYAENLLDESYIVFDAVTAVTSTSRFNLPRSYGVQLRYTW